MMGPQGRSSNLVSGVGRRRLVRLAAACIALAGWLVPLLAAAQPQPAQPQPAQPQPAQPQPAQPQPPKIVDIVVVGNKSINRESIVATSGLKVGDPLTQASLDEAKRRLLLTQNFGANHPDNPEAGVTVQAQIEGEAAKVVIEVDENDVVRGINITGTGPVRAAIIRDLLQTTEGRVLNMGTLRSDIDRIQTYYTDHGYQAFVSSDISFNNGILTLPIVVGRIGQVRITGLKKTKEFVVTREMSQKSGEYFNIDQFRKDYTRIYNTGLFEDVSPTIGQPSPGVVDLNLSMQEKRTGTVSVFVGYSSRNQLVGGAEVGESNFLGRGQQISLRWDTGGLANRSGFEVGFTEPWLDKRHTSLSVNLYDKTVYRFAQRISSPDTPTNSTDYYEVRTGGQVMVSRPFSETYRGYVGLRYDNVRVPPLDLNPTDAAALQNGPLAAVNFRVTHNTRDVDLDPASGGYELYSLDVGQADLKPVRTTGGSTPVGGVFGTVTFQKYQADARRYFSLQGARKNLKDRRNVIALRLVLGTSTGTLPFFEQYFVGGAETLRGYNEDRFWGKNMFLGSVEYRAPLANALTGVLFADIGDAWGGAYENVRFQGFAQHAGFSPSLGLGLGLRVVTPIGPIRIDQGFGREGAKTHFSIGHVF